MYFIYYRNRNHSYCGYVVTRIIGWLETVGYYSEPINNSTAVKGYEEVNIFYLYIRKVYWSSFRALIE